jgi:hypothetical protein
LRDEKKTFGEMYTKVRQLDKDFTVTKKTLAAELGDHFEGEQSNTKPTAMAKTTVSGPGQSL